MPALNREHLAANVCIIGGGMAGLCAALASARNGAKTILIHDRPVLGGNASSEIRMWICGAHGPNNKETGLLEETQLANLHRNPSLNYSIWDSILWEKAHFQPRLTTLLNATCTGAQTAGNHITQITAWQLTTQTQFTIEADHFIDCSGDSILAATPSIPSSTPSTPATPIACRHGRESRDEFGEDIEPEVADHKTMGSSLLIQMHRCDSPQPFTPPRWAYKFDTPEDLAFRIRGVDAANFWWLEIGGLNDTIRDSERIRDELMRIAYGVWDYLKNRAPEREKAVNWAIHWIGSLPGKRESRRYEGDHIMTQLDIQAAGPFADTIAYGGWTMDDHHPAGLLYPGQPTIFHPAPPIYGIPYRSLYSRNIDNLLFAGRNISVTHAALSSTRVMATCSVLGQAAGTAAALCHKHGCSPRDIYEHHLPELQQTLCDDDCYLPGFTRRIDELSRAAKFDGAWTGISTLCDGEDRDRPGASHTCTGPLGQPLEMRWDHPVAVGGLRLTLDSNLSHDKRMPCAYPVKGDRCAMPGTLLKAFRLEALNESGDWSVVAREEENIQRLIRLPLNIRTRAIRLIPEATWSDAGREGGRSGGGGVRGVRGVRGGWGDDIARLHAMEAVTTHQDKIPIIPDAPRFADLRARQSPADLAAPAKNDSATRAHPRISA